MPDDLNGLKIDKGSSPRSRRSRKGLWWILAAAAIVIALLAAKGVFSPQIEVETAAVSLVYPSQSFSLLNASGYVVAQRKAAVAAKTTGQLEWLGVEEGSRVNEGQVIARLENRDVTASRDQAVAGLAQARASLDQAKAELNDATLNYNRIKELADQGIVARADLDSAEARFKKARAAVAGGESGVRNATSALKGAEVAVDYTLIRAPFDAVVLTKNADVGDIVTPIGAAANAKAAVVSIADLGSLQVEADVSESNLEKVKVGQPCEIQLDALPEIRFAGQVHMVVPTADRSKATVLVKVRFLEKDSRILPEMSARVAFLQRPVAADEKRPRIAVSPAAVVSRDGKQVVFLVEKDRAVATPVTLGGKIGDLVEVTAGLKAGQKIVARPSEKLKSGAVLKASEKK